MYKGTITNAITNQATNTNIPFTTAWNTNTNTRYNPSTNAVDIYDPGYYDVSVQMVMTDITTDVTVQLYADGVAIPESAATYTVGATTNVITANINDTIRIIPTSANTVASISVRLSGTTTTADIDVGVFTVEKRK